MTNGPAETPPPPDPDRLLLQLQGFEGPLDLLLELARAQKLDLAQISILSLVEQYLAVFEGARQVRLELAADWLVMAAWLTWLKSKLLLPAGTAEALEAEIAAEALAARLQELQIMRAGAAWLGARPQLRQDIFPRGAPEDLVERDTSGIKADLPSMVSAYLAALRRAGARTQYRPPTPALWTVQEAIKRITAMLGVGPGWAELMQFLPESEELSPRERKGALASTLIAGLEMAKGGVAQLRQEEIFGPIMIGGPGEIAKGKRDDE